jgi:hypothetical protein
MFNRKLYISLVLLFALIAVLPSCKHTPEDVGGPELNIIECHPTIDSMRQWFFFRPGSWWVYQEESSGALDTIRVTYYDDSQSPGGNAQIVTQAVSSLDGYTYEYYFNDSWTRPTRQSAYCSHFQIGLAKHRLGDVAGEEYFFFYPFSFTDYLYVTDYDSPNYRRGKSFIDHYYIAYILGSQDTIHNAYRFILDYDVTNESRHSEYTWARGVGLVRKEFEGQADSSLVWNLIDFNVAN